MADKKSMAMILGMGPKMPPPAAESDDEGPDDTNHGMQAAMHDLLHAIDVKDVSGMMDAFSAAMECHEPDEDDEGGEGGEGGE